MKKTNEFGTKTFDEFNRKFFESLTLPDVHYFSREVVVANIRPDVNAKISLQTNGVHGEYSGYMVYIIHKINGDIANEWFGFDDYMKKLKTEHAGEFYPHVIEHCGIDWWCQGAEPEDIKNFVKKIVEYISLFS